MEEEKTTKVFNKQKPKRKLSGVVKTAKDKTVVVQVARHKMHPIYKKRFRVTKNYHAHDEQSQFKVGDKVTIEEARPYSKLKRWRAIYPKK